MGERQFHLRVSSGRLTQQQHQLRRHERNVSSTSESPVGGSRSNNTNFVVTRGTSVPPPSLQWEAHAATTPTSSSREERQFHLRVSSGRLTQQQHQLRRHERNVSSTSESPV